MTGKGAKIKPEGSEEINRRWGYTETKALLALWKDPDMQRLINSSRNSEAWDQIATTLAKKGFLRAVDHCKTKIHNLKSTYRQVKKRKRRTGESAVDWEFFDDLDEVLGCVYDTALSNAVETSVDDESEQEVDETVPLTEGETL